MNKFVSYTWFVMFKDMQFKSLMNLNTFN